MIAWLKRWLFGEKPAEMTPEERAEDLRKWWVDQAREYHGGFDTMDGEV